MPKKTKKFLFFLGLVIFLFIGLEYWQNNYSNLGNDDLSNQTSDQITYSNSKYLYSLKFPQAWFINFLGDTKETADLITLVSHKTDLTGGDGGPPKGAKVQIFIQDIKELQAVDQDFPQINSVDDWINWERTYQAGFDTEALGEPLDESITVTSQNAFKSSYLAPLYPKDMAKEIKVTLLNPPKTHIFQIQYLAQEPEFSNQLENFDLIINSFYFSN